MKQELVPHSARTALVIPYAVLSLPRRPDPISRPRQNHDFPGPQTEWSISQKAQFIMSTLSTDTYPRYQP